jgi:hypothetical protein
MDYQTYSNDGKRSISVVRSNGDIINVTDAHPNFQTIFDKVVTNATQVEPDENEIYELSQPVLSVGSKLTKLSERVSVQGNSLYFDGDPINDAISAHILRFIKEDRPVNHYRYLIKFLENLQLNPSKESRDSLYEYLLRYNFAISPEGYILAYKGVRKDGSSVWEGQAIVDDVVFNGHIPNTIGSIIEMPRSKVNADTNVACAPGLHAGSYEYAKNWARGKLLKVLIHPRDVVSVPKDSSFQKLRTCRYTVIEETELEWNEAVFGNSNQECPECGYDEEDNDWEECPDCGYDINDDYDDYDDEDDELDIDDEPEDEDEENVLFNVPTPNLVKDEVVVTPVATVANSSDSVVTVFQKAIAANAKVAFSYETVNGEPREVTGFTPETLDVERGIVGGKNADDNYRSYIITGVTDPEAYTAQGNIL